MFKVFRGRSPKCPVCNGEYNNISRSKDICNGHSSWIVTICKICGNKTISDTPGECIDCLRRDNNTDIFILSESVRIKRERQYFSLINKGSRDWEI